MFRPRRFFFPIHSFEFNKFFPTVSLMFCILLNQNLIRAIKEAVLVHKMKAESIGFIKILVELPLGILFLIMYIYLSNKKTSEQVFRWMICIFLAFFTLFAFIIFPHFAFFHPSLQLIYKYIGLLPHLKWLITIWGNWSVTLFYVMSELWAVIVYLLSFWHLTNKIVNTEAAKRFYVLFSFFGQVNLLVHARLIFSITKGVNWLLSYANKFSICIDKMALMVQVMTVCMLALGIVILVIHRYIEVKHIRPLKGLTHENSKSSTLQLNVKQSIKMIVGSKYLACVFMLVASYSATIILIEGLWLAKARSFYPDVQDFMEYRAKIEFGTGMLAIFCTFVGGVIIRALGWFWGAIMPPLSMLLGGGLFFTFAAFERQLSCLLSPFITCMPLSIVIFMGGVQNIIVKGAKYALFDATKAMVYIPLDNEMKTKGKAAVDILGSSLGKCIGAVIPCLLFTIFPKADYDDILPVLLTIFLMICIIWTYGVMVLYRQYKQFLSS